MTVLTAPVTEMSGLGRMPEIAVLSTVGLMILAVADSFGRWGIVVAEPLFWLGLLVLVGPTSARLLSRSSSGQERLALICLLGLCLYLVKVLHSPTGFVFFDEFSHWRTADDIVRSGQLFEDNPLARVSPLYPGLQLSTISLAVISGLSLSGAGMVVLAAARLVLVIALFTVFHHASSSRRIAGIATLLYISNPNFLFFSAQYMYESLAMPLAALALSTLVLRERSRPEYRAGFTLIFIVGFLALVTTHHLASFGIALFLALWTILSRLFYRTEDRRSPISRAWLTVFAFAAIGAWLLLVAGATVNYVFAVLNEAVRGVISLIAGEETAKTPFRASTGQIAPIWERLAGFGAIGLILVGLPVGLWHCWSRRKQHSLIVVLALIGAAYPASLGLRLTQAGTETSNRASEFLFIGVAFVLALALAETSVPHWFKVLIVRIVSGMHVPVPGYVLPTLLRATYVVVIFMGGLTIGWAPYARMPGPYLVGADPRSVDERSLASAAWMAQYLGPDNAVLTDRTNRQLVGSYGQQTPQVGYVGNLPVSNVIISPTYGATEQDIVNRRDIRFLLIDQRLSASLPLIGIYFELGEQDAYRHTAPLSNQALTKFDAVSGASRIFDDGTIVIYDLTGPPAPEAP